MGHVRDGGPHVSDRRDTVRVPAASAPVVGVEVGRKCYDDPVFVPVEVAREVAAAILATIDAV